MMKTTIVSKVSKPNKLSYVREIVKLDDNVPVETIGVPVIDVRDGEDEKRICNAMIKASNQSKYMKPSYSVIGRSYQVSHKKD